MRAIAKKAMRTAQRILFCAALFIPTFSYAVLLDSPNLPEQVEQKREAVPFVVAIQTDTDMKPYEKAVKATVKALTDQFGARRLVLQHLTEDELRKELEESKFDFLLTTADFFSRSNSKETQLFPIASLWPRYSSSPSEVEGALYFTRASNRSTRSVEDLSRKSLALTSTKSFSGYLVARRDVLRRGIDPKKFFENVTFFGDDPLDVVQAVAQNQAFAGILPTGAFEYLSHQGKINASDFRLIGVKQFGSRTHAYSTELYPSLYFSRTLKVSQRRANLVLEVLRSPKVVASGFRWGPPASDRVIQDLFYDLRIGPYEKLGRWSFEGFMQENKLEFSIAASAALLIILYSMIVSYAVRKRTRELRLALRERERIERDANASRDRIASLERAGMIGQMSTMIAHELKQPIGAITNFAHGMLRRAKRGDINTEVLINVLEEIVDQGTRASEIVNRVRSYAKQKTPKLVTADLSVSVDRAVENFQRSRRSKAQILKDVPPYLWAEIDDWEIELAVLNLLKNADDSTKEMTDAEIRVRVFQFEQFWRIEVSDNGPAVKQEQVDQFMMLFMTTKESGLGLGLSLVSTIAERHKGRLIGRANPTRGVTLSLDVPRSGIEPEDV